MNIHNDGNLFGVAADTIIKSVKRTGAATVENLSTVGTKMSMGISCCGLCEGAAAVFALCAFPLSPLESVGAASVRSSGSCR